MDRSTSDGFPRSRDGDHRARNPGPGETPVVASLALTILWHPDLGRVGEYSLLGELDAGGMLELSRSTPRFVAVGDREGVMAAALCDPYLSRTPCRLRRSGDGGVVLDCGESNAWVALDGERSLLGREMGRTELERGVVMLLANRVLLLLHGPCDAGPVPQNRKIETTRLLLRYLREELHQRGREALLADPGPYAQPWLPAPVLDRLVRYPWPGERAQIKGFAEGLVELFVDRPHAADEDAVERLLRETAERGAEYAPPGEHSSPFILADGYVARTSSEISDAELMQALQRNRWQIGPTARQLGVAKRTVFLRLEKMGAAGEQLRGRKMGR